MTPELELLDQCVDSPLRVQVVASLFPNWPSFENASRAMAEDGQIELHSQDGEGLPLWQLDEWIRDSRFAEAAGEYIVVVTERGLEITE